MGTNIKFYTSNNININSSFSFTSASTILAKYLYDNNYLTKLTSSGSNDSTPEVLIITFPTVVAASSIFIGEHNIKSGNIKYSDNNQGSWKDFSTAIAYTNNTDTFNYHEFNEVQNITDLRVTMNTTQVVDAEKYVSQLRLINLFGELITQPFNVEFAYRENSFFHNLSDGGNVYVQFGRKASIFLHFDDSDNTDVSLFRGLKDYFSPFYVYLNGGDSTQVQEPFRVQDMFLVNYINEYAPNIRKKSLLNAGTEIDVELQEV
jgi:hypothetical protein